MRGIWLLLAACGPEPGRVWRNCDPAPTGPEVCDGADNDCDGWVDEDACSPGAVVTMDQADAAWTAEDVSFSGELARGVGDFTGDGRPDAVVRIGEEARLLSAPPGSAAIAVAAAWSSASLDALAGAGDLDGDGLGDLLLGGLDAASEHRTWILLGDPAPTGGEAAEAAAGALAGAWWAAAAGDTDGDGRGEVLVSSWAPGEDMRGFWLVPAPLGGPADPAEGWLLAGGSGSLLPQGAAGVGDVDGDGLDDVAIGSPGDGGDAGAAYLFLGPVSADRTIADAESAQRGEEPGDAAGAALAGGDLNEDGYADVLVSAPDAPRGAQRGSVYLLEGPLSGDLSLADAAAELLGPEPGSRIGMRIAVGDSDGDGWGDVLVSANRAGDAAPDVAFLQRGPLAGALPLAAADVRFQQPGLGDFPNPRVELPGDLDGDGAGEILLGLPYADGGRGSAYLFAL